MRRNFKLITTVLLTFLICASIPVAVYLVQQRQEIRKRAAWGDICERYTDTWSCCNVDFECRKRWQNGECVFYDCDVDVTDSSQCKKVCDGNGDDFPTQCRNKGGNYIDSNNSCKLDGQVCYGSMDNCLGPSKQISCQTSNNEKTISLTNNNDFTISITKYDQHCPEQTTDQGACHGPPGTSDNLGAHDTTSVSTEADCGGYQIEITSSYGGCAHYGFLGSCPEPEPEPEPTATPTPSPTPSPTPTLTPTPTPTPVYELACKILEVYDENWEKIEDLTTIAVGDTVRFLVEGLCDEPQGITNARFRINEGEWLEKTGQKWGKFYLGSTISVAGSYKVEAMVYNAILGWR